MSYTYGSNFVVVCFRFEAVDFTHILLGTSLVLTMKWWYDRRILLNTISLIHCWLKQPLHVLSNRMDLLNIMRDAMGPINTRKYLRITSECSYAYEDHHWTDFAWSGFDVSSMVSDHNHDIMHTYVDRVNSSTHYRCRRMSSEFV